MRERRDLSSAEVARGMRLAIFEGVAFAATVGLGEMFFLAHAIRLTATRLQQGLVASLPLFVGSVGALLAILALGRLSRRRTLVATASAAQALVLASLSIASWTGSASAELLIVMAALYGVCGQSSGTAWSSWIGDLVPVEVRGRYFALRNRWIYVTTFVALLAGGLLLDRLEPGGAAEAAATDGRSAGFATLYGLAALCRMTSAVLHSLTPEPTFGGLTPRSRAVAYLATREGRGVSRLLFVTAAFYFAVYVASPYFAPYMLEELRFSYIEYTAATATVVFAKVLLLPVHGNWIDRGRLRRVNVTCAVLIGVVPIPFFLADGLGLVLIAQALSGIAWGGYEVSHFTLILDRTSRRVRPHVFALQSTMLGTAQLAGSLVGAALLTGRAGLAIGTLFLVSAAGRLLMAGVLGLAVSPIPLDRRVKQRSLLIRVMGVRASGGLALRLMPSSRVRGGAASKEDGGTEPGTDPPL